MNPIVIFIVNYVLPPLVWLVSFFVPRYGARRGWREAKNKSRVMTVVNNVDKMLTPEQLEMPLVELVDISYQNDQLPALFAVEGVGFLYTGRFYDRDLPRKNILTNPSLNALPEKSLTMLHAGMGLSLSSQTLRGLTKESSNGEIQERLKTFLALCQNNSKQGYMGCAFEILGVPAVILHGLIMMQRLAEQLTRLDPIAAEYMWHGVGRALYFYPANFIPGIKNPWKAFDMAAQLAPSEPVRKNIIAGISWALTLVNIRHPEIMEAVVSRRPGNEAEDDAVINGIMSAVIMYHDTAPDDILLRKFIKHQPYGNSELAKTWTEAISVPCERAIQEVYPILKERQSLEDIFHYQPLYALEN